MNSHLFVASDGALYDTRATNWSAKALRPNYCLAHRAIDNAADFKATLRHGAFAWPGGYPMFFICDDGAALCFSCARKEARNIIGAIAERQNSGWRVVACDTNYEDSDLFCAHCNAQIKSACGAD